MLTFVKSLSTTCYFSITVYQSDKYWKVYGISTSFVRKGRATRLEGNFGTQKQHYSLSKIKARNRKIEILWIFFGIHTANAILMIDKIKNRQRETA